MARKDRTVASRHKALEPVVPEAPFTLAAVRLMYHGRRWQGAPLHDCRPLSDMGLRIPTD